MSHKFESLEIGEEPDEEEFGTALLRQAFEKSLVAKSRRDMSWQVNRTPYGWPGCVLEDAMQPSGRSLMALHNTRSMIQQFPAELNREGLECSRSYISPFTRPSMPSEDVDGAFSLRCNSLHSIPRHDGGLSQRDAAGLSNTNSNIRNRNPVQMGDTFKDRMPNLDVDLMDAEPSMQQFISCTHQPEGCSTATAGTITGGSPETTRTVTFSFSDSQTGSKPFLKPESSDAVLRDPFEDCKPEDKVERAVSEGDLPNQPLVRQNANPSSRPPLPSRLNSKTPFVNFNISSAAAGVPLPPITNASLRPSTSRKNVGPHVDSAIDLDMQQHSGEERFSPPTSDSAFGTKFRRRSETSGAVPQINNRLSIQTGSPPNDAPMHPGSVALGAPGFRGPAGLQLRVDSYMSQGSWDSGGWAPGQRELSLHLRAPSDLQMISPDDLVKEYELGRGCHGKVWLAKWRGVHVALKELISGGVSTPDSREPDPFDEAQRLASLRHPCIITLYGIVAESGSCAMAVEFLRMGSLRSGLKRLRSQGLCHPRVKAAIALQAARGMEYLHDRDIVHFDLKCENFLCDLRDLLRPVVKIGDLGLSQVKKEKYIAGNMRGTLPFMAPELFCSSAKDDGGLCLEEDQVNEKVDVYSFGVCLWEIWTMCAEQPYSNMAIEDIFAGVITGSLRPSLPEDMDLEWARLIEDCWKTDATQRPSFTVVAERLDACLQRWRLDSDSTSQVLSKINPEVGVLCQQHNGPFTSADASLRTPPLNNTPSAAALCALEGNAVMKDSETSYMSLGIAKDCLRLGDTYMT